MSVCCTWLLLSHLVPLSKSKLCEESVSVSFLWNNEWCLLSRVNLRNTKRLPCTLKLPDTILQHRVIPFSSAAVFHMKMKLFHEHWNETWLLMEVKPFSLQISFLSHLCPNLPHQSSLRSFMHKTVCTVPRSPMLTADLTISSPAFPSARVLPLPLFF